MEVAVFLDHKFLRTPDGRIWATTMFGPAFWSRYLEVFSKVWVVARLRSIESPPDSATCVNSDAVEFADTPYYEGPWQFWKVRSAIGNLARDTIRPGRAVILRVPQAIPFRAFHECLRLGAPFAAEIVADPWDMFSPGANLHPARPFFRRWFTRELRSVCRHAEATSYVTAKALQERYPPAEGKFTQGVSDVEIEEVATAARTPESFRTEPLRCVTVGAFHQLYKAQDILIRAVGILHRQNFPIQLSLVGDGYHRPHLEELAQRAGATEVIRFAGQLASGKAVIEQLDKADLFLLPSRQEGLPRALVEAMARGLPAIASDVGGIPELLEPTCLVKPNDIDGLAERIRRFANDPDFLAAQSKRNLAVAEQFVRRNLNAQRRAFYEQVLTASESRPGA